MSKLAGIGVLIVIFTGATRGQDGDAIAPLKLLSTTEGASLMGVTSVVLSPDQKFAYTAAWGFDGIATFARDIETGALKKIDSFSDKKKLRNAVAIRVSPDGQYAAAAISTGDGVVLYKRDAMTGKLTELDYATDQNFGQETVKYVIEVVFSPDGKFLYAGTLNGIVTFDVSGEKLAPVDLKGMEGKTKDTRSVALSADGKFLYAVFKASNSVAVFKRDQAKGTLKLHDILTDGEGGVESIEGPSYAVGCPLNKFVYVSGARFGGDDAVSVFQHGRDGRLEMTQVLRSGERGVPAFSGGNEAKLSPDGAFYYMTATNTDSLLRFSRNPQTGKLKFVDMIAVGKRALPGASGLCFSADGKMLYVADENSSAVVQFAVPKKAAGEE